MNRPKFFWLWTCMLLLACLMEWGCWQIAEWIHERGMRESVQNAAARYETGLRERLDALRTQLLLDGASLDVAGGVPTVSLDGLLKRFPEIRRIEIRDESAGLLHTWDAAEALARRQTLSPGLLAIFNHASSGRNVVYSSPYYEKSSSSPPASHALSEPRLDILVPKHGGRNQMVVATLNPRYWLNEGLMDSLALGDKNIRYQLLDEQQRVVVDNGSAPLVPADTVQVTEQLNVSGLELTVRASRRMDSEPGFQSLRILISLFGGLLVLLATLLIRSSIMRRHATARLRTLQAKAEMDARAITMGEMSTAIAHELNQPLGAIENFAHGCERLLQRPEIPVQELIRGLQQIRAETQRGAKVITSIRSFVKRENQTSEVVDVSEVIEGLRPLLDIQAKKLQAKLNVQCPQGLQVQANRALFEQVILNLARNGLESMQETPVADRALSIRSALTIHDSVRHVTIWVEDRGCGVEESLRDKLFSPFFTTKATGMGIGLSLCQSIVERQGGSIRWQHGSPTGSCFELNLPVVAGGG